MSVAIFGTFLFKAKKYSIGDQLIKIDLIFAISLIFPRWKSYKKYFELHENAL